MSASLRRVRADDAAALLAFERDNRDHFEARINARPADFYSPAGVQAALAQAEADAEADRGHQFLLEDGALLGRFNLSRVRRAHFHSADVGYRIGEAHTGRGLAKTGLALLKAQAFGALGLLRLEAVTHSGNLASQRVLQAQGFRQYGRSTKSFELNGLWFDSLHWECHA